MGFYRFLGVLRILAIIGALFAIFTAFTTEGGAPVWTVAVLLAGVIALTTFLRKRYEQKIFDILQEPCTQCGSSASVGHRVCSDCGRVKNSALK